MRKVKISKVKICLNLSALSRPLHPPHIPTIPSYLDVFGSLLSQPELRANYSRLLYGICLDRKVESSVRKALVKLFSERPVCRADKLHLVLTSILLPEGGWFATSAYSAISVDLLPSLIQHVFDSHQGLHDTPTPRRGGFDLFEIANSFYIIREKQIKYPSFRF